MAEAMRKYILLTALLAHLSPVTTASTTTSQSIPFFPFLISIGTPLLAAVVIFLCYEYITDTSAYIGAAAGLISVTAVTQLYKNTGTATAPWITALDIQFSFHSDGLSNMIAFLAASIGSLIFIYARGYMDHGDRKRRFYTLLAAFMGSMIGLVYADNLILLFTFWELTSICSYLLISHHQHAQESIAAATKSLLITIGSGIFLLIGFILLYTATGTWSLTTMLASPTTTLSHLHQTQLFLPILILLGIGAGAKAAQVPFHIWLPDAMQAPTPVSAYLHSATMVKAGIYLIARMRPLLMQDIAWTILFSTIGLLTMLTGAVLATVATELKELLAYSTASHLGMIIAGLAVTSITGAETGSFHILNHAVFKAALFMTAGIVLHKAGTQRIAKLSGLKNQIPYTAAAATIAGLAMAGLPPLNGFYSKELLFKATYNASSHSIIAWLLPAIAVLASIFTFIYSLRFISIFYGTSSHQVQPPSRTMTGPPLLLAIAALTIGLFPTQPINTIISPALTAITTTSHHMSVHLPDSLTPAAVMSIITIITGITGYSYRKTLNPALSTINSPQWLQPTTFYHLIKGSLVTAGRTLVTLIETGLVRTYSSWVLLLAAITGSGGLLISGSLPDLTIVAPVQAIIVLATAAFAAYAIVKAPSYIASVLTLSILGFMVSIYYLLLDAPDLVLTQLVVETLTLIIFLLILDRLPPLTKNLKPLRQYEDIALSLFIGLTVFTTVLYTTAEQTPDRTATYFTETALPGSGGANIVNTILVDFRGLDTLGEIAVIAMAALAIWMLFKQRTTTDNRSQ